MGSSPRVRGSRWCCSRRDMFTGIIPAGAGLTTCPNCGKPMFRDHPRGCGAHTLSCVCTESKRGSSPRVRGSPSDVDITAHLLGIIPAGAGLTRRSAEQVPRSRDHPRGCGAHRSNLSRRPPCRGSSPRVRGSLDTSSSISTVPGIIPAGAGLTANSTRRNTARRDHPRGCGAHERKPSSLFSTTGSSPRVRGSLHLSACLVSFFGIIPAGAGLTSAELQTTLGCGDHPRGCGAHLTRTSASGCLMGSSPRVRGSPLNFSMLLLSHGIIPAGAGLTLTAHRRLGALRDHPRGCGAH